MISLRQNANAERQDRGGNVEPTDEPTISEVITTADEAIFELELFREI
jgi:hypothetical protein